MTLADVIQGTSQDVLQIPTFITENFVGGATFSDWRMSYGLRQTHPWTAYLAIYPAFCVNPYAVFHYTTAEALTTALNEILSIHADSESGSLSLFDKVAAVFSISRGKESFELFQEQKDLMDLGLKHFCLDNFYQDHIKKVCSEYYDKGTINGHVFELTNIITKRP